MKITSQLLITIFCLLSSAHGGINDELNNIFNMRHVAALVPARESYFMENESDSEGQICTMIYKPDKAFMVKEGAFEASLKAVKITNWTFGMQAPWDGSKKTSWVILDSKGNPFLSMTLLEKQPDLIIISQLLPGKRGAASLGRSGQYLFRCELSSAEFTTFLKSTAVKNKKKFVPIKKEE